MPLHQCSCPAQALSQSDSHAWLPLQAPAVQRTQQGGIHVHFTTVGCSSCHFLHMILISYEKKGCGLHQRHNGVLLCCGEKDGLFLSFITELLQRRALARAQRRAALVPEPLPQAQRRLRPHSLQRHPTSQ